MPVRIRLARFGCKHRPYYRIHVIDSRKKRDGQPLEYLGAYDPIPTRHRMKTVRLNFERVRYWLSVGAQPTDTVAYLLSLANIIPPKPYIPIDERKPRPLSKKAKLNRKGGAKFSTLAYHPAFAASPATGLDLNLFSGSVEKSQMYSRIFGSSA